MDCSAQDAGDPTWSINERSEHCQSSPDKLTAGTFSYTDGTLQKEVNARIAQHLKEVGAALCLDIPLLWFDG